MPLRFANRTGTLEDGAAAAGMGGGEPKHAAQGHTAEPDGPPELSRENTSSRGQRLAAIVAWLSNRCGAVRMAVQQRSGL